MRALLIWNPIAGRRPERRAATVKAAARTLERAGWRVELATTEPESGARAAARAGIAAGVDVLIACGGDGTLGQIAGEIARRSAGNHALNGLPQLALLPGGTANVYGRHIALPLDMLHAAKRLPHSRPRRVPLGRADFSDGRSEHFIAFASAGFDAHVVHRVSPRLKKALGKPAFVLTALIGAWRYGFDEVEITVDHAGERQRLRANQVIFGFTRHYGGGFGFGPARDRAEPCAIALRGGRWAIGLHSLSFIAGILHRSLGARCWPARAVEIAGPAIPVQLDGEVCGFSPVRFTAEHEALTLLVP